MGLPGFEPGFPTPEAGRIPGYPTNPLLFFVYFYVLFNLILLCDGNTLRCLFNYSLAANLKIYFNQYYKQKK